MNKFTLLASAFLLQTSIGNSQIVVSELNYNPNDNFAEFIEIKNVGTSNVNLSGATFTKGITFTFPNNSIIETGKFIVLAQAEEKPKFETSYGFEPFGYYDGKLSNSGEQITLKNSSNEKLFDFTFDDEYPWCVSADGAGFSLVLIDPQADMNDANNWRASLQLGGTPNQDETMDNNFPEILVNEILPYSNGADAIEILNNSNESVNIGGWYLTDNSKEPQKWQIPANTIIETGEVIVFYEGTPSGDTLNKTNHFGESFSLNKNGEGAFIFATDSDGNLNGYSHGYNYGESESNVSFGRVCNSANLSYFIPLQEPSLGSANNKPRIPALAFEEIMYNPAGNDLEYVKITNCSDVAHDLTNWKITGIGFDESVLEGFSLKSGNSFYIIGVEETIATNLNTVNGLIEEFRTNKNIDSKTPIFIFTSSLSNSGETLTIERAGNSYLDDTEIVIPTYIEDIVDYKDCEPWATNCDGNGEYLIRKNLKDFGCEPQNWTESTIARPIANAGKDAITILGSIVNLSGANSYYIHNPEAEFSYTWNLIEKPINSTAQLSSTSTEATSFVCDLSGKYVATLFVEYQGMTSLTDTIVIYEYNYLMSSDINENDNQITIYPTISDGKIYFSATENIESIEVFNINGYKIENLEIDQADNSIFINEKGTFVIKINCQNSSLQKFIFIR